MDLYLVALNEIALEGLEGVSIDRIWELLGKRQPPIDCAIDQWTKPAIWEELVFSQHVEFYHIDFDGKKSDDIPGNKKVERVAKKMPPFWINDHRNGNMGYSQSYFYRSHVSSEIRNEDRTVKMTYIEAAERWGDLLHVVATQACRQRTLFGTNYPPIIEEVTAPRFIILEIIGKSRWDGFTQADFQRLFGLDSRTSFHHVKVLMQLHLITKQSVLVKSNKNPLGGKVEPPRCSKMLHLRQYSSVFTNHLQRTASRICMILEQAPDQTVERNKLKEMCSDIPRFKKIRQWLFHAGYIQYIVNGEIWSHENTNPMQLTHFRASRPCYVNLVKAFDAQDVEDDKDEFLDYIENCDDIEPQLVMEETLHSQAYQILLAVRERGITMKKLAEILCIPHYMARSVIRFFDTNKIGRLISVDYLKQKVQKIVAIQYLHQSDTVKNIQKNKAKIEEHRNIKTELVNVKREGGDDVKPQVSTIKEMNLKLADTLDLTRVHEKSKVSLRPLARKNFILDALAKQPVYEGYNELYKRLVVSEDGMKSTTGTCCRKTFRKIVASLAKEYQLKELSVVVDDNCIPPLKTIFLCAPHIEEDSEEMKVVINLVKERHENQIRRKAMRYAATKREPGEKNSKRFKRKHLRSEEGVDVKQIKLERHDESLNEAGSAQPIGEQNEGQVTSPTKDGKSGHESDTDDEEFVDKKKICGRYRSNFSKYFTYGRFQRLHVLHMFLWQLVYGKPEDLDDFEQCSEYLDLIKSQRMWLEHVKGLPTYSQGNGWFNVGDIISLMPLELTCRILGIKCWSNTAIKYLDDPVKRFTLMANLPPKLKYKLLASTANKQHLDNCVDLLVLLSQMGLIAVPPNFYPKMRAEIMLFLRKEAVITDTRFSEKGYCHSRLPSNMTEFPKTKYLFRSLKDLKNYWEDLQFICLNTPLGLSRATRTPAQVAEDMNAEDIALGKAGINQTSTSKGLGRNYRSFTILRDFQSYYEGKDFNNMEPNVFGNGLGAGGMDSIFFAHLVKNWRTIDLKNVKRKLKKETDGDDKSPKDTAVDQSTSTTDTAKKFVVPSSLIKKKKGGKGLKRTSLANKIVVTKKMKMDRKKKFDQLIAKRFENIREKIKQREMKRKSTLRKSKKVQQAMNHDDTDREALRLMKGLRVSFTDREDAYILLADIVRTIMNLSAKGQPLEKEHPKILWRAIRDILHKDIPESKDKTWNAINRRARYIKKYPHSLIVYKTCMAELEQNKEFMGSIKCTKENWKEMLVHYFNATREIYSKHFNQPVTLEGFPDSMEEVHQSYIIEYADKEKEGTKQLVPERTEKSIRISILQNLMHNAMIAQRSPTYKPSLAFKLFDVYGEDEMRAAFDHFKKNRLVSRLRCDLPRSRSLPVTTMTYTLSAQTYDRIFEPSMPIRVFNAARCFYMQLRDGKKHTGKCKEQDLPRLPCINQHGSLDVNFKEMQGGHLAYIINAMLSKKVILNFTLNDEMIVADEEHMKKLQKDGLNFQRVAFEQRVRKGRTMKRLSTLSPSKDVVTDDDSDSNLSSSCRDNVNKNDSAQVIDDQTLNKNDSAQVIDDLILNKDDGVHAFDDQQPCCSKSLDTQSESMETREVAESSGKVKSPTQPASVESTLAKLEKMKNIETQTNRKRKISIEHGETPLGEPKKRKVAFVEPTKPLSGAFEEYFGTRDGLLNGFFSRLSSNNSDDVTVYPDSAKGFNRSRIFAYTHFVKKPAKPVVVDIFKETKLFASRTSLAMHRSLKYERLDPMNAMNTHDALVVNPMQMNVNLVTSPFRSFFYKLKHKPDEEIDSMWQRIKASDKIDDVNIIRLTETEYEDILRNNLKLSGELLVEHLQVAALLKSRGNLGISLNEFQAECKKSNPLFMQDFDRNLQTLLNFQMAYKVGHKETVLVHCLCANIWTFRAPQAVNSVESKGQNSESKTSPEEKDDTKSKTVDSDTSNSSKKLEADLSDDTKSKTADSDTSNSSKKLEADLSDDTKSKTADSDTSNSSKKLEADLSDDTESKTADSDTSNSSKKPEEDLSGREKEAKSVEISKVSVDDCGTTEIAESKNKKSIDNKTAVTGIGTVEVFVEKTVLSGKKLMETIEKENEITGTKTTVASKGTTETTVISEKENLDSNRETENPPVETLSAESKGKDSTEKNTTKRSLRKRRTHQVVDEELNIQCDYRNIKVFPWLKMNGELNGVLLRRFQENVLVHILLHPGIKEIHILKHFELILFPEATKVLLKFLELNKSISKHYMVRRKTTLFGSPLPCQSNVGDSNDIYYLPTVTTMLNMTDTNR